jgi:hypothetical protein
LGKFGASEDWSRSLILLSSRLGIFELFQLRLIENELTVDVALLHSCGGLLFSLCPFDKKTYAGRIFTVLLFFALWKRSR